MRHRGPWTLGSSRYLGVSSALACRRTGAAMQKFLARSFFLMLKRAYYQKRISEFANSASDSIFGALTAANSFPVEIQQRNAWLHQIRQLKQALISSPDSYVFDECLSGVSHPSSARDDYLRPQRGY